MSTYKGEGQFEQRSNVRPISTEAVSSESHPEDRGEENAWLLKAGGGYDNSKKRHHSLAQATGWAWHNDEKDSTTDSGYKENYKAEAHTGPTLKNPVRQFKTYQAGRGVGEGATVSEAYKNAFNAAENKRIESTTKVAEDIAALDKAKAESRRMGYSKPNVVKIDSNPYKGK